MQGEVNKIPEDGARRIPEGQLSGVPLGEVIVFLLGVACFSWEKWLLQYGGMSSIGNPAAILPPLSPKPLTPDSFWVTVDHTALPLPKPKLSDCARESCTLSL